MNRELLTFLLGASPILEVRGAIPVAIGVFHLSPFWAYFWGVAGNFVPILPLLAGWYYFSERLMKKSYWINRFLTWLFAYTREKHQEKFNYHHHHHLRAVIEFFVLFAFVGIPIPLTGAWTATVAAFVFGIPIRRAAPPIFLGVLASGAIILAMTVGIVNLPIFR